MLHRLINADYEAWLETKDDQNEGNDVNKDDEQETNEPDDDEEKIEDSDKDDS